MLIYKLVNTDFDMIYIGQTNDLEKEKFRFSSKRGRKSERDIAKELFYAFGTENESLEFTFLEECKYKNAEETKLKYIKQYYSIEPNGYNKDLEIRKEKLIDNKVRRFLECNYDEEVIMTCTTEEFCTNTDFNTILVNGLIKGKVMTLGWMII